MLTLYIRVRAFSYAKNKVDVHKIQTNAAKSRSIRTELKKSYILTNPCEKRLFLKSHIFETLIGLSTFVFFLINSF